MLKKSLTGVLLLAGAAGGPYVLFETDAGNQARKGAAQVFGVSQTSSISGGDLSSVPGDGATDWSGVESWAAPGTPGATSDAQHVPFFALRDVLRFDVNPASLPDSFPRVTTVLADLHLDGLRVPLVTGSTPSDLAGTLTYYFDPYKRVQRITIHGVTGDPNQIIAELQKDFRLQQLPSLGGLLYTLNWNGQFTSICQVTTAPVIYAENHYARYSVFIELNQPNMHYGLSSEASALVYAGKQTQRW